jgi:hypothetical protein
MPATSCAARALTTSVSLGAADAPASFESDETVMNGVLNVAFHQQSQCHLDPRLYCRADFWLLADLFDDLFLSPAEPRKTYRFRSSANMS